MRFTLQTVRKLGIAALLGVMCVSSVSRAQNTPDTPRPGRANRETNRENAQRPGGQIFADVIELMGTLNLTEEQNAKVRTIIRETRDTMREKMQDAQTMDGRERLNLMRDTFDQMQTQIGDVLDDAQKKTFDEGVAKLRADVEKQAQERRNGGTTRPTTAPTGRVGGGGLGGRLDAVMADLNLTEDQKTKVEPIMADARQKVLAILAEARQGGNTDRQAMREKVQAVMQETREKLRDVLTPEQQEKLQSAMSQRPGAARNGGANAAPTEMTPDKPATPPATKPADGTSMMSPDDGPPAAHDATAHNTTPTLEAGDAGLLALTPPALGKPAPAFSLVQLDNRTAADNKSLAGKPSLIVFGSYTAPTFRDRAPQLVTVAKRFGTRVNVLVVYTRELFPAGGNEVERNVEEKIEVAAHASYEDRVAAAKKARDALNLKVDIAADTMDDAATKAFAGYPNAAVILDDKGNVVAFQKWFDAFAAERAMDGLLARK